MTEASHRNRLDLNRCPAARLSTVTGIGADKANRIIAYRRRKQGFASVGEVMNVRGVKDEDLKVSSLIFLCLRWFLLDLPDIHLICAVAF